MRKLLFLAVLIFIHLSLFSQNSNHFEIQITDEQSKEALPFATILINKNPHRGNVSNLNGWVSLDLLPSDSCIQISYVGYNSRIIRRNDIVSRVGLNSVKVNLDEVIVYSRENPAHRIIKKAVANRKINNPDNIPEYVCKIYNKSAYDYVLKDDSSNDSTLLDIKEYSKNNHILFLESATERYYKSPNKIKEIIKKVRVSGFKDPSFAPMSTDLQPFHFYDPLIELVDIAYLNPISLGSHRKYIFLIEDTLYSNTDTTFIISYQPKKNSNFDGLKGFVHINTNKYAIEKVIAEPAEKKLLSLYVQQNYEYQNEYWFPKELKSELKWEEMYNQGYGAGYRTESYISGFRIDVPDDSIKYSEEVLVFDKLATKDANLEMGKYRTFDLSLKEQNTYSTLDSLGEKFNFDYWQTIAEKLTESKLPISKFYIPIDKIITRNDFEGYRLGMGLYTDDKLLSWLELGGWGAYGFTDKEWKYGADLSFFFDRKKENALSGSYAYDAVFPGNQDFNRKKTYIEGYFLQQADYATKFSASFKTRIRYAEFKFNFLNDKRSPQYKYSYLLDNNWVDNYEITEIGAQMRFAYKEKYIWQFNQKIKVETKWPVFSIGYKKGLKDVYGGEIDYDKLWLSLDYNYHFPRLGLSMIRVEAGKTWGDVPYSFLFAGAGGWSSSMPFIVMNRFNTMTPNQFANNEIISAFFSHDFGTRLFATENWKPKVIVMQAFGIGNLTNTDVHKDIQLSDMNKGYYESGILIDDLYRYNVWDVFYLGAGVGGFYNYGYYSSSNWKNNIKLKFNVNISF